MVLQPPFSNPVCLNDLAGFDISHQHVRLFARGSTHQQLSFSSIITTHP
jgi:hypothetical protein